MENFLKHMFKNTPDYRLAIEDETFVNGIYSATWTMQGTWQGDKIKYKVPGMSIIKFREGESLIYYQRDYFSEGEIWSKIPYIGAFIRGLRGKYKRDLDYKEE